MTSRSECVAGRIGALHPKRRERGHAPTPMAACAKSKKRAVLWARTGDGAVGVATPMGAVVCSAETTNVIDAWAGSAAAIVVPVAARVAARSAAAVVAACP